MARDTSTVVLISGANRGLGRGLLERFLAAPNHTVIAANRDPSAPTSKTLADLPVGPGSKLIVVKLDGNIHEDSFAAAKELVSQGIDKLDIVIANAGISNVFPLVKDLRIDDLRAHMQLNVYGAVSLYQAIRPLLLKSETPIWVTMGSAAGWIGNQLSVPNAAYAPTKITIHWLTKRIDAEEEKIAAIVMDPGWVQTDMGNNGAKALGLGDKAPLGLDESVTGMMKVISAVTKDSHGGKLWCHDGTEEQW